MHELSIAQAVLDIALEHAGDRTVRRIEVRAGHLRQVVPDALTFAFELVSVGTAAEGAELVLEEVAATVRCHACAAVGDLQRFPAQCARCGGFDVEITGGEELLVDSIEVTDEQPVGQEA